MNPQEEFEKRIDEMRARMSQARSRSARAALESSRANRFVGMSPEMLRGVRGFLELSARQVQEDIRAIEEALGSSRSSTTRTQPTKLRLRYKKTSSAPRKTSSKKSAAKKAESSN